MKFIQTFLDLIFPRFCHICQQRIFDEKILCNECRKLLKFRNKVEHPSESSFQQAYAVYDFNPSIQKLIHEFKYNELKNIGVFLGEQAAEYIQSQKVFPHVDYIVPVPLHSVRKRFRGFNQSEVLTKTIAQKCKIPHLPHLIMRRRYTQTQTKLGRLARKQNVAGAFRCKSAEKVRGKSILLVDDVFTTGATVETISNLLQNNGVSRIIVLTIARA